MPPAMKEINSFSTVLKSDDIWLMVSVVWFGSEQRGGRVDVGCAQLEL